MQTVLEEQQLDQQASLVDNYNKVMFNMQEKSKPGIISKYMQQCKSLTSRVQQPNSNNNTEPNK